MPRTVWELFIDGSDTPVPWITHRPNSRFAIYNPGGTSSPTDDLVLDKETGLIWPRNANLKVAAMNWLDANTTCRELVLANRTGWRLPTVEELSSLVDHRAANPALPHGHPFVSVQAGAGVWAYWTSTNHENPSAAAWFVSFGSGDAGLATKGGNPQILGFVWPVRGGRGAVNWNW
jgi:predicted ribosomally synthesized peptide with SipW-like signal peptide